MTEATAVEIRDAIRKVAVNIRELVGEVRMLKEYKANNSLPSAEQRTGRWINKRQDTERQKYIECSCSECGETLIYIKGLHTRYLYCPN